MDVCFWEECVCMKETVLLSVTQYPPPSKKKKREPELSWVTSEAPLPFQQGLIWRTRSRVPWALMSALHSTPPSQPRRLCRNLAHSRHPTATSHSHLEQRERTLLIGWNTNKQMARKSTQSLMLTRPMCSKHITSAKHRSLGATVTVYTCLF